VPDSDPRNPKGFVYRRNGGLMVKRRVDLGPGELLVRFSSKTDRSGRIRSDEDHLNSPWWLNDDRFVLLLGRARTAGVSLVEMARRSLAIPSDWSNCDLLVRARPRFLLAAYAGPGITAEAGAERRIIAYEAKELWIEQLYIPGLGRQSWLYRPPRNAARLWLDFAGTLSATGAGFRGRP
jgi:hypothetical protein